jgi:hypothetical protein
LPRKRGEHLRVAGRFAQHLARQVGGAFSPVRSAGTAAGGRIVFQAFSVHLAQFYEPIVREIRRQDPDADLWFSIVAHPHFPQRTVGDLRTYARDALAIDLSRIHGSWRMKRAAADLLVCSDVFAEFQDRTPSALIAHGPGIGSRMLRRHLLRKTIFDFDLLLVNGSFDRRRLEQARDDTGARTRIEDVGLPFLDGLNRNQSGRGDYLKRLSLDPGRPTILFGPAWTGLAGLADRGYEYATQTVRELSRLPVNVLIKLHACSLNPLMAGGVDWHEWLHESRSRHVAVDTDPNDLPALAHSEILVTDRSSRALNFMALSKPVVLCDPSPVPLDSWDRERLRLIESGSLVASTASEVASLCGQALDDPDVGTAGVGVAREAISFFGCASEAAAAKLLREAATDALQTDLPTPEADERCNVLEL